MGDVNQSPHVAMKTITDDCNSNSSCSADSIGKIIEFIDPPNQLETINFTFHMTDVVRQKDE